MLTQYDLEIGLNKQKIAEINKILLSSEINELYPMLFSLLQEGNITESCKRLGIKRQGLYVGWRDKQEDDQKWFVSVLKVMRELGLDLQVVERVKAADLLNTHTFQQMVTTAKAAMLWPLVDAAHPVINAIEDVRTNIQTCYPHVGDNAGLLIDQVAQDIELVLNTYIIEHSRLSIIRQLTEIANANVSEQERHQFVLQFASIKESRVIPHSTLCDEKALSTALRKVRRFIKKYGLHCKPFEKHIQQFRKKPAHNTTDSSNDRVLLQYSALASILHIIAFDRLISDKNLTFVKQYASVNESTCEITCCIFDGAYDSFLKQKTSAENKQHGSFWYAAKQLRLFHENCEHYGRNGGL